MTTKKLKTGQRVTLQGKHADKWAAVYEDHSARFFRTRREARDYQGACVGYQCHIVRLNPITGVVSK